jgi:hypothetical protein
MSINKIKRSDVHLSSLSEAALKNLEKLCDRSERDALRGSGDER